MTAVSELRRTYELRVHLADLPNIWRRVRLPSDTLLADLHVTLQIVFGWDDQHLHCFERSGVRYGIPDDDDKRVTDQAGVRVGQLISEVGDTLLYVYDFGDWWEHRIELVGVHLFAAGDALAQCIDGARAGPPEDCGGPAGFTKLLEALADARHPDHLDTLEWLDGFYFPEHFDATEVNQRLTLYLGRRRKR